MSNRCKTCGKPEQCRHSRHAVFMVPRLTKALRAMLEANFSERSELHSAVVMAHDALEDAQNVNLVPF